MDDEEVNIDDLLDVSSGIYIEKEIAADTIGTIFAATKSHFLPYVEQCTLELLGLLNHFYEGIRKSATDSLLEIIRTFYDLSEPAEWQPGYAVSPQSRCTACSSLTDFASERCASRPACEGARQPRHSPAYRYVRD